MNKERREFRKFLTRHHRVLNGLAGASLVPLVLEWKLNFSGTGFPGLLIWMTGILALLWAANVATQITDEQSRRKQLSRTRQAPAIGEDLILLLPRSNRNLLLTSEEQRFLGHMHAKYRTFSGRQLAHR